MKSLIYYALITARAGSKGIKNKNLKKIKKKNLVEISLDAIKKAGEIKKIFCTSDSKKILKICKNKGIEIIRRPKKLAGDNSKSLDVVLHFLKTLKKQKIKYPDVIFLLQPTSPFLESKVVRKIIEIYKKIPSANTVNSFVEIPHKYNLINHVTIGKNGRVNYLFYNKRKRNTLRQNKKNYFAHGNVFSFKTKAVLKFKTLMPKPIYSTLLDRRYKSIDIDDYEDLKISRILNEKKF